MSEPTPTFDDLGLRPPLLAGVARAGFTVPTPIQSAALPLMLFGLDLIGHAETGSGKTAAFGLGLLQQVDPTDRAVSALVLCPTRELAEQVADELRRLAVCMDNTRIITLCGGRSSHEQRRALAEGCQVVVGTPGRVTDHIRRGHLDLSRLKVLVLDEADRLLDMGFVDQVREATDACPADRQTLLFSATLSEAVTDLSADTQQTPEQVSVVESAAPAQLRQQLHATTPDDRDALIIDLLAAHRPSQALIFCETRASCRALAARLRRAGAAALALHGELDQRDRDERLVQFTNESASILVATDIAARGLDIPELPLVLIAELSAQPENHIHRIGRTGRAGEDGLALVVTAARYDPARLERIEDLLGAPIPPAPRPPPQGSLSFMQPKYQTLLLLSGRRDRLSRGDVLGALVKDGGIPPAAVGRIDLSRQTCAVAIRREHARAALAFAQRGRFKKRRVRAKLL